MTRAHEKIKNVNNLLTRSSWRCSSSELSNPRKRSRTCCRVMFSRLGATPTGTGWTATAVVALRDCLQSPHRSWLEAHRVAHVPWTNWLQHCIRITLFAQESEEARQTKQVKVKSCISGGSNLRRLLCLDIFFASRLDNHWIKAALERVSNRGMSVSYIDLAWYHVTVTTA